MDARTEPAGAAQGPNCQEHGWQKEEKEGQRRGRYYHCCRGSHAGGGWQGGRGGKIRRRLKGRTGETGCREEVGTGRQFEGKSRTFSAPWVGHGRTRTLQTTA